MSLALPLFLQLATAFAPSVVPETLVSFAQYESRLEPNAIYNNSTGETFLPATSAAAAKLAASLLAQGHSLDLGIMQVNSAYQLARHSGPGGEDVGDQVAKRRLLELWDDLAPEGLPLPSPQERIALAPDGEIGGQ